MATVIAMFQMSASATKVGVVLLAVFPCHASTPNVQAMVAATPDHVNVTLAGKVQSVNLSLWNATLRVARMVPAIAEQEPARVKLGGVGMIACWDSRSLRKKRRIKKRRRKLQTTQRKRKHKGVLLHPVEVI
jgi:hypothetical protein